MAQGQIFTLLMFSDQLTDGLAKMPVVNEDIVSSRRAQDNGLLVSHLCAHRNCLLNVHSLLTQLGQGHGKVFSQGHHELR
jgi:hypothetical protein